MVRGHPRGKGRVRRYLRLDAPSLPTAKAGKPQQQTTAGFSSPSSLFPSAFSEQRAKPRPPSLAAPYPELGLEYMNLCQFPDRKAW